jgi:adenylate cyclase
VYLDTARRLAALLDVSLSSLTAASERAGDRDVAAPAPATIAVLPFESLDPAGESRFFSEGLVEDLITRLGRCWFPVISRSSTFAYRGPVEPHRARAELGADYLIEGSVQRAGDTVRVTARLTETAEGRQIWSNRYDRAYERVFALQDGLVADIVGQASGVVLDREVRAALGRDPVDLSAWELSLRGSWHFHRRSKESNAEARALLERALQRDPGLPLAFYHLALTHQRSIINQWSPDLGASVRAMLDVGAEFGRHHPGDAGVRVVGAYTAIYTGEREAAAGLLREAIELDPNATTAYSLYGQTLAMGNHPDEAIEQFELAVRLSPRDSDLWTIQTAMALCHFVAERYPEMLQWAARAVQSRPDLPFPRGAVAVARTCLGDDEGAVAAVNAMLDLEPATTVRGLAGVVRATHEPIAARYLEALRRAGVPA